MGLGLEMLIISMDLRISCITVYFYSGKSLLCEWVLVPFRIY
jgi:hypothetical protein